MTHESGTLQPDAVRGMFDRIAPVYDVMNRVMTAGLDRKWRRLTVEAVVRPGDRVLDACCGTGDLAVAAERRGGHGHGARLLGRDARARATEVADRRVGRGRPPGAALRRRRPSTRRPSASASGTSPTSTWRRRAAARAPARRAARDPRDHAAPRRPAAVLLALVRPDRAAARQGAPRRARVRVPPRKRASLPRRRGARRAARARRLRAGALPAARRVDRRAAHGVRT